MRKPRLFIAQALKQGDIIAPEPDRAHYLINVLRLRAGQSLRVFNNSGAEFEARARNGPQAQGRTGDRRGR